MLSSKAVAAGAKAALSGCILVFAAPAYAETTPPDVAPPARPRAQYVPPEPHAYQAPPPDPAQDAPSHAPGDSTAPRELDHRIEGSLRGGVMFPGEISPSNWFHTQANAAPSVGLDAGWVAHRNFWLGGYLQLTSFTFDRKSGDEVIGDGNGAFTSVGLSAKGRLPVSETVILGAGLTVGRNAINYEGESTDGNTFELSGGGWNVGAATETLLRVSTKLGVSAQLSFLSQVSGSADLEGYPTSITGEAEGRKFSFKPIFFFTIGPALFL